MKVHVMVHLDHTIDSDLSVAASVAKHCEEIETMIYAASALAESVTYGYEGDNEYYFFDGSCLRCGVAKEAGDTPRDRREAHDGRKIRQQKNHN